MRVSVVIPTYQRKDLVLAAVRSLQAQAFDKPFEIIVAIDGSTDGTADALKLLGVSVLEQRNAGAAAARNLGAARAKGEIILFLDDDMEADPKLLAEHDRSHRAGANAVLGHMPLHPDSAKNVISEAVAEWTDERLERLSKPGAELSLHDLLTGQLSVSAKVFKALSGFDKTFTEGGAFGNEDVDFGHRLLRGGYDIRFNPAAVSFQKYSVTPETHFRQWRQAGQADVLFARKHPEEALSLFHLNGLESPFARRVAIPVSKVPFWGLLTGPFRALGLAMGDRRHWRAKKLFFQARDLEYWRGVEEAGGPPTQGALTILAYHAMTDLSGKLRSYGVPLDQFRRQIALLKRKRFNFIGPAEFAAFVEGRSGLPKRAVMLTFDDCYLDLEDAAKIMRAEGVGALAFAVSGQLGGTNAWDAKFGGPSLHLMDANGLKRLAPLGVEVGAHSRNHALLTYLEPPSIEAEIKGSVSDLEAAGLTRPRFFAYPYGENDDRCRAAARDAGVIAAFSITPGVMRRGGDLMQIPRVEVLRGDEGLVLLAKIAFARQLGLIARLKRAIEWRWRTVASAGNRQQPA